MSNEVIDEIEEDETPTTTEEFTANFVQDLVLNSDPSLLASDFIDDFVLKERLETPQILALLEMPTENLCQMVKQLIEQAYQAQNEAVDNHGVDYLEGLKAAVKSQMLELAK